MKRPILIITLGFIIGNIMGLYFNIASFFILLIFIYISLILKNIKINSKQYYIRLLNIFIKNNIILLFLISAGISNLYLIIYNAKYERIYNNFKQEEIIATVVSNKKETEYKNTYEIKLEEFKGVHFLLRISKNKDIEINYGDRIRIRGEYKVPEKARNYGGFDYKEYLKTKKIYGIYEANSVKILGNKNVSPIELFSNNLKQKIITNINTILPESTRELFLGILIGDDDNLQKDIEESFKKSSLTHLLAVSGAHIVYIITGLEFIFRLLKIPKRIRSILTICVLILFMYIVDFSASVVRASIMGIILLMALIFYRKNDLINTISISCLIILIDNPYKILDIGLILSYFATIGIICFTKFKDRKIKEENNIYSKILSYLKELVFITISANIFIVPIMIYNFNTISLTFIISNLIAGILIEPITIGGFILIILLFISLKLAYLVGILYNLLIEILIFSTKFTSLLPFSEIFVPTPNIFIVIIYYVILFLYISYKHLKNQNNKRYLNKKFLYCMQIFIEYLKKNYKTIVIFTILIIIVFSIFNKLTKDLKIYFIDVGQGDSTLVITPTNKRILIDSGGAESGNFDVGKSTLFPYLLDRGITNLDYICVSHFDSDHCDGFKYLLENMKIKNIILSKQYESTHNFEKIMGIVGKKKINVIVVEAGNILNIDKFVKLQILSPSKEISSDINDNSIVMKLEYFNFSCLFTGDISESIEKNLVKKYAKYLNSNILKVGHHGSNTSSCEEFISTVKPKISLIGVGKDNKFGHPKSEVIERLQNINSKIYRTDLNGEINIFVDRKGRIKISM